MKLISMTDFVLNQKQSESFNEKTFINEALISLEKIRNYANFLKQPLNLGMFVPCDEDEDILEEPKDYEQRLPNMMTEYNDEVYRYKQAKEKVLFVFKPHFDISAIKHHILQDRNIEYLANFGELELTENAIKQIGL